MKNLTLRISALGIIGIIALISIVWGVLFFNTQNNSENQTTTILAEKADALFIAIEAATRSNGRSMPALKNTIKQILHELSGQQDINFIAITDPNGKILAHTNPRYIGSALFSPYDLELLQPDTFVKWALMDVEDSSVFLVYREFTPFRRTFNSSKPNIYDENEHIKNFTFENRGLGLSALIFVAYDPKPLLITQETLNYNNTLKNITILLISLIILILIFWWENLTKTYKLLKDTQVLSKEIMSNFPDALIILNSKQQIIFLNSKAKDLLKNALLLPKKKDETPETTTKTKQKKDNKPILPDFLQKVFIKLEKNNFINSEEIYLDLLNDNAEKNKHCFEIRASRVYRRKYLPFWKKLLQYNINATDKTKLVDMLLIRDQTKIKDLQNSLQKSEKLAAIGHLSAGVAHEIRNPLSSIKGYATIFYNLFKPQSPEQEAAQAMIKEIERLNRAVSNLLDLSKDFSLNIQNVELKQLVEHLSVLISSEAQKKNIIIEQELENIGEKQYDADKISQALLNILLNALEAMPNGGKLKISLHNIQEQTTNFKVEITIQDNGNGISAENLEQIFNPYFTTRAEGTGLGLATTQKIIEAHNGKIIATSDENGTVFKILLP
ncbi:ATP-binding protein [Desulfovibrio litoralis]|uniref:histidine kinase n=1 Tax=Desulfovibrio litoralis DSM 11393 TaxID=1121455 RepID=A0A1M7SQE9_9BACT|nr:ATP-binding protein [Desulfovibrio litoralis]SHN60743.1 His Kinase A (phospho-acceptor) domain-containing protein [Desulfovibrio litoralis DSM 11393]